MNKIAAPTPEQLKKQEALKQYFEKLYELKDEFFTKPDTIQSFIEYDINQYLKSEK